MTDALSPRFDRRSDLFDVTDTRAFFLSSISCRLFSSLMTVGSAMEYYSAARLKHFSAPIYFEQIWGIL
jgi:hypothetical protein